MSFALGTTKADYGWKEWFPVIIGAYYILLSKEREWIAPTYTNGFGKKHGAIAALQVMWA